MARGARGAHDAGVRVESLWRRSAECRPPSGEAWQLAFSWRPVHSGASVSRAASRTLGDRPTRSSDALVGRRSQAGERSSARATVLTPDARVAWSRVARGNRTPGLPQ